MESKIIKQEKNPFLNREEMIFEIKSDAAPSFEEIKKQIGKDENIVAVKKVNSNFGTQTFTAEVFVYDSPEAKKKIETIPKKIKKQQAEEEKKAAESKPTEEKLEEPTQAEQKPEAPTEAPVESKPTEETKPEETKPEETKSEVQEKE
jgi:ribosomal protein S24E